MLGPRARFDGLTLVYKSTTLFNLRMLSASNQFFARPHFTPFL